ncbi:MAG: pyrF [Bacilli bacterium]|nr:pyrF [Bacilli bacterium]
MRLLQDFQPEDRLFIALDVDSLDEVKRITDALGPCFRSYKVGLQLFSQEGPRVIQWLVEQGCRVFADLKFHDIPNTVAGAAAAMTRLGVFLFNVHVAGGVSMMQSTMEAVRKTAGEANLSELPIVLGVTQLTSTSQSTLSEEIGIPLTVAETVQRYALLAQKAGLSGVVASAKESVLVRSACGSEFVILTPGIRPAGTDLFDQTRVTTPAGAMQQGADLLVVGRPITRAQDMRLTAEQIVHDMKHYE